MQIIIIAAVFKYFKLSLLTSHFFSIFPTDVFFFHVKRFNELWLLCTSWQNKLSLCLSLCLCLWPNQYQKLCYTIWEAWALSLSLSFLSANWLQSSGGFTPSDNGGGGDGHPDPEIRGGPASKKIFSVLQASFWSKNKGGPAPQAPPLDSAVALPLTATSPRQPLFLADSPHIDSYLNLSTMATFFCPQGGRWRGINCTRTKVSYPSCNLLCIWYISELFLQLIKSTPEVSSLAINFIWVHCSPRSLHPLPKCRTQFKRWPESTFS